MRIKIDENIPTSAVQPFESAGHDVDTVVDEQLSGAADAAVLHAAKAAGRLIVTLDRGFGDIRAYPPGSHGGILVLRVEDQSPPSVRRAVERLLADVDLDDLAECVSVFRSGKLRVRRPSAR